MFATKIQPTEGQFIAVWKFGGKLWSRTCIMDDGVLKAFNPSKDKFEPCGFIGNMTHDTLYLTETHPETTEIPNLKDSD